MTVQQKLFKVLVIGDYCKDIYYKCRNTRLNPESSAPLVQVTSMYFSEGMAANVTRCLENLGLVVAALMPNNNSTKTRYINAATNEQLLRVDFEDKVEPLSLKDLKCVLPSNHEYDAIVVSDYDKGFLTYDMINSIQELAGTAPVFLDTKKNILTYFDSRIFLKINEHEANAAKHVPKHAIITLGANGAMWYNERWSAFKSETVDVCGAGDAFLAGLVYGYLYTVTEMLKYGIVNAGISVRHIGTYAPSEKELLEGMKEYKHR